MRCGNEFVASVDTEGRTTTWSVDAKRLVSRGRLSHDVVLLTINVNT